MDFLKELFGSSGEDTYLGNEGSLQQSSGTGKVELSPACQSGEEATLDVCWLAGLQV